MVLIALVCILVSYISEDSAGKVMNYANASNEFIEEDTMLNNYGISDESLLTL